MLFFNSSLLILINLIIKFKMHILILFLIFSFSSFIKAQENQSFLVVEKKLDLILKKVTALEDRVSKLESSNTEVKKEVKRSQSLQKKQKNPFSPFPRNLKKEIISSKLGQTAQNTANLESGPWTKASTWSEMRKNLSSLQVRKLLGNPTKIKKSINPLYRSDVYLLR